MIDAQNRFSNEQSLIAAVGNVLSTNSIDLKAAGSDWLGNSVNGFKDKGRTRGLKILAQIITAVTSAGAATLQVQVITGTGVDGAGQINAGVKVLAQTDAIPKATLVQGYQFLLDNLPMGVDQRYLALRYVIGTADITAGTIYAALVREIQLQ